MVGGGLDEGTEFVEGRVGDVGCDEFSGFFLCDKSNIRMQFVRERVV